MDANAYTNETYTVFIFVNLNGVILYKSLRTAPNLPILAARFVGPLELATKLRRRASDTGITTQLELDALDIPDSKLTRFQQRVRDARTVRK